MTTQYKTLGPDDVIQKLDEISGNGIRWSTVSTFRCGRKVKEMGPFQFRRPIAEKCSHPYAKAGAVGEPIICMICKEDITPIAEKEPQIGGTVDCDRCGNEKFPMNQCNCAEKKNMSELDELRAKKQHLIDSLKAIRADQLRDDIEAALIEAWKEAKFPDIGICPHKMEKRDGFEEAFARLKSGLCTQQKGVPDQTALVWRADISKVSDELIIQKCRGDSFRSAMAERDALKKEVEEARQILDVVAPCSLVEGAHGIIRAYEECVTGRDQLRAQLDEAREEIERHKSVIADRTEEVVWYDKQMQSKEHELNGLRQRAEEAEKKLYETRN